MSIIKIENNKIIFQQRDELVCIEPYGADCVRVRATRNAVLSDEKWILLPQSEDNAVVKTESENSFTLENGMISVNIYKTWAGYTIVFFKDGKEILRTREEGDSVRKYCHTEGNNYTVKAIFEADENEHIYGLGQEQCSYFNKKGCSSELIHYNTKSSMPVIYSSLGYGFFWNNPAVGRCEFTNNHTMWEAESAYQADYLVFVGKTPADVMYKYCQLTGFSPNMPEWAAGFWQCKLRYESQEDLLEVAREYRKRNIPIDAIVIDYFHWTEQGNWEFDPELWPAPKKMCEELEKLKIRPVVSIWPTINPNSKNYRPMDDDIAYTAFPVYQSKNSDWYHISLTVDFDGGKIIQGTVTRNGNTVLELNDESIVAVNLAKMRMIDYYSVAGMSLDNVMIKPADRVRDRQRDGFLRTVRLCRIRLKLILT